MISKNPDEMSKAAWLAWCFHDIYEELAPQFGYATRPESRVEFSDVPEANRNLMIATCQRLLDEGVIIIDLPKRPDRHYSSLPEALVDRQRFAETTHDDEVCATGLGDLTEYETGCVGGDLYGHCGEKNCGGLCQFVDECSCSCHKQ